MKIEVVGKNGFIPSANNKDYIAKKLSKLENFFDENHTLEARVVCKVYKEFHKVEVTIPIKKGILRAEVSDENLYSAVDKTIEKLISQIRKYKTRTNTKMDKDGLKDLYVEASVDTDEIEREIFVSKLVKNKELKVYPLDLDEAIQQMDLLGHSFFVYTDKASNNTHILYKRDDGDYAVIELAN
ncbi:MAG: ribosome hibernation-promoting factor, HPF/YfiA family [Anaeroplasmataceae bacterium]